MCDVVVCDTLSLSLRYFVVQDMLAQSQLGASHSVNDLLVYMKSFAVRLFSHWFGEDVVCVEMQCNHDNLVAPLRCV